MKKILKWFLIFIVASIVLGAIATSFDKSEKKNKAEDVGESNDKKAGVLLFYVQQQIKNNSKDPDSVQFRNEQIHDKTDSGAVACGEFNGKNSFGAYTGFKGFVAVEKDMTLYIEDGVNGDKFAKNWNKFCVNK